MQISPPWFVYILRCRDGSLYTGVTPNVAKRFAQHIRGQGAKYTKSHPPVKIVYQERQVNHNFALKREAAIKKLSHIQKLQLCQNWAQLPPQATR